MEHFVERYRCAILWRCAFPVTHVRTGRRHFSRRRLLSMAVLDAWMPETSGLEVQARLHEVSPDTKVIVMTGRETPAIRAAALEGGAFAFLLKPFDDEAFLSLVRQTRRSAA